MSTAIEAMQVQSLIVEAQNLIAHARRINHSVTIMQGPHGPLIRTKKIIGNEPSLTAPPEVLRECDTAHN